ncbi:MAG TPA: hypothetical protein VIJ83_03955 [Solirubrobacteraceae bacterium]
MNARPISLSAARRIVAVGAVALAVFMFFFNWYGGSVTGLPLGAHLVGATVSTTGWQTFTVSRWVWLLTILVALGSVVALSRGYKDDGPLPLSALVAGLGALASALIVIRILHHPGPSVSGTSVHVTYGIKTGIWLGLVAALAIALGGYVQTLPEKPQKAEDDAPEDPAAAFSGLIVGSSPEAAGTGSSESAGEPTPPKT